MWIHTYVISLVPKHGNNLGLGERKKRWKEYTRLASIFLKNAYFEKPQQRWLGCVSETGTECPLEIDVVIPFSILFDIIEICN